MFDTWRQCCLFNPRLVAITETLRNIERNSAWTAEANLEDFVWAFSFLLIWFVLWWSNIDEAKGHKAQSETI